MQRLTTQKIIPKAKTPIPTPNSTGNWNLPERAAVIPPPMHKPMPARMHRATIRIQTYPGIDDGLDLLILPMDSRKSLWLITPLRGAGYVLSYSALQQPPEWWSQKMIERRERKQTSVTPTLNNGNVNSIGIHWNNDHLVSFDGCSKIEMAARRSESEWWRFAVDVRRLLYQKTRHATFLNRNECLALVQTAKTRECMTFFINLDVNALSLCKTEEGWRQWREENESLSSIKPFSWIRSKWKKDFAWFLSWWLKNHHRTRCSASAGRQYIRLSWCVSSAETD